MPMQSIHAGLDKSSYSSGSRSLYQWLPEGENARLTFTVSVRMF
jgi:hypothetical protein